VTKPNWGKAARHDKANRRELGLDEISETGHPGAMPFGPRVRRPLVNRSLRRAACPSVACAAGREKAKECLVGRSGTPLDLCDGKQPSLLSALRCRMFEGVGSSPSNNQSGGVNAARGNSSGRPI
jgi:hypothetical protein